MSDDAVFELDAERFLPGRYAIGPWSPDLLHGGPVLALITRAVERAAPDPELVLARLSVDMFRPVPAAPLTLALETLRKGSRLLLLRVTVSGEAGPLAQGTALLLRASEQASTAEAVAPERAPDCEGLPIQSLIRSSDGPRERHAGFHTRVETRWVPARTGQPLAIWFRLPIPLIAGEPSSPLVNAVALSDFANAIASIAASQRGTVRPYINADSTLYLNRRPQGEWFCLADHGCESERGISLAQARLFDSHGLLGSAQQARLIVK